jgi:hypothetical protein
MVPVCAAQWKRLEAVAAAGHGLPPSAGQLANVLIAWALGRVEEMTPEAIKKLAEQTADPRG